MNTTLKKIMAAVLVMMLVPWSLPAQGQPPRAADTQTVNMPVPAVIHQLKAHEVVERIIGQRHQLFLSDAQFDELTSLHKAVLEERAIYESTGRSKPPYQRPVWITTPEPALAKAFTMLAPQQQNQ